MGDETLERISLAAFVVAVACGVCAMAALSVPALTRALDWCVGLGMVALCVGIGAVMESADEWFDRVTKH